MGEVRIIKVRMIKVVENEKKQDWGTTDELATGT